MKILHFILVINFALIMIISGCGGSSSTTSDGNTASDSNTITEENTAIAITGTLTGGEFVQFNWLDRLCNKIVNIAYAAGNKPDKVVVVAKNGYILDNFEIAEDGTFEIEIADLEEENFTLFIQNTVTGEVSGHIKLSNNENSEKLDIFEGSAFKGGLQLGAMDVNNLTGPSIEDTDAFKDDDKVRFKELATNDDAIGTHQNKLRNSGISSYLSIRFNLGTVASVTDSFFDISTFTKDLHFKGMMPLFYYFADDAEELISVELYPPADILHSNPNNTQSDFICNIPATQAVGIEKSGLNYCPCGLVTIETAYVDSLPRGDWTLINDDTDSTLGSFVFAEAKPFNNSNVFKAFVPIPKINTDTENNVISVTLKLNRYDNSGSKPINKHFFDTISEELLISYKLSTNDFTQNMVLLETDDESLELIFEPPEEMNVIDLERLIISYLIGEAKYQFFIE